MEGSPFVNLDEPQHNIKGKITKDILNLLGIKFLIIRSNKSFTKITKLINFSKKNNRPVALLVEKNIIKLRSKTKVKKNIHNGVKREIIIKELLKKIKKNTKLISTTGYTSRELFQIRKHENIKVGKDFYMVGGGAFFDGFSGS